MDSQRVYSLLLICILVTIDCVACVPSNELASPPTIEPPEPPPTATISPTATAEPTETPTTTLTPAPDIATLAEACDAGLLVVSAGVGSAGSGIYLVCADGSFMQQIVSTEIDLPDAEPNRRIAVSPDGRKLAFDSRQHLDDLLYKSKIYVLDLFNYELTEVHSGEFLILDINWSPDGQYLGYLRFVPGYKIEILHIDSQTVSEIISDRRSAEEQLPGFDLADFDWSPDGTTINYRLDPPYGYSRDDLPPTNTWYMEDITCDAQTHICSTSDQRIIDYWSSNIIYSLSWAPDSSQLVGIGAIDYYSPFVEVRQLDGQLIWQIELDDILLSKRSGDYRDANLSPDGKQIVFVGEEEAILKDDIYILSLEDMSLFNVTDRFGYQAVEYFQVEWLPERK